MVLELPRARPYVPARASPLSHRPGPAHAAPPLPKDETGNDRNGQEASRRLPGGWLAWGTLASSALPPRRSPSESLSAFPTARREESKDSMAEPALTHDLFTDAAWLGSLVPMGCLGFKTTTQKARYACPRCTGLKQMPVEAGTGLLHKECIYRWLLRQGLCVHFTGSSHRELQEVLPNCRRFGGFRTKTSQVSL